MNVEYELLTQLLDWDLTDVFHACRPLLAMDTYVDGLVASQQNLRGSEPIELLRSPFRSHYHRALLCTPLTAGSIENLNRAVLCQNHPKTVWLDFYLDRMVENQREAIPAEEES